MYDFQELNPNDDNDGLGLGDLNDIFNDDPFANAGAASPSGEISLSQRPHHLINFGDQLLSIMIQCCH